MTSDDGRDEGAPAEGGGALARAGTVGGDITAEVAAAPGADTDAAAREGRRGVAQGLAAYTLWGTLPVYFLALAPAGPWEILTHRIAWSLVLCLLLLLTFRSGRGLLEAVRRPKRLVGLVLAGVLIAANWTFYLVAVTSGHVTDAALGYFLNPLVSVALGLLVLGERLRRVQAAAVAVGAAGGLYLAAAAGHVPWIAFALAGSFGLYGLVKKRLGASLSAIESLTAETAVLAPFAAALIGWQIAAGTATFTTEGPAHAALLASTGLITTVPLLLFAGAARRVPLVTIGLMQFIAPILQFVAGLALGEHMSGPRWIGFGIVWAALLLLVVDSIRTAHGSRRPRAS